MSGMLSKDHQSFSKKAGAGFLVKHSFERFQITIEWTFKENVRTDVVTNLGTAPEPCLPRS